MKGREISTQTDQIEASNAPVRKAQVDMNVQVSFCPQTSGWIAIPFEFFSPRLGTQLYLLSGFTDDKTVSVPSNTEQR